MQLLKNPVSDWQKSFAFFIAFYKDSDFFPGILGGGQLAFILCSYAAQMCIHLMYIFCGF